MRIRDGALALALLAAPATTWAQPFQGPYIGAGAGYNLPENDPLAGGGVIEPGGGFVGLGSVGYGLGDGFRFELEGNYREAPLPSESNATVSSNSGNLHTYVVMANVLYDLDIGLPWLFPYFGGGAGYAWSNFTRDRTFTAAAAPLESGHFDSTEGGFAFQAIAGLSFPVPHVPGLIVTAEYRFFGIPGTETFNGDQTVGGFAAPFPVSIKVEHQYDHSFLLGVRYAFGQVPPASPMVAPAAAPAPAVQPARSYLVFFDWDKASLTDRARQIIREAADNSTHVRVTRIEVNGYTDTSGTPQYNMGLSIRRANAVKAELVRDGVPAGEITTQGFGETHLLVPTGAGVREPQNRRVEIVLH
ncbi:MAG TPA: OmpA family protein [Acetobacteraceae bacterium]|nr:OmpA family protein [Acetobacteraceae bacterium]